MKTKLKYCDQCQQKCLLRECRHWGNCQKACANIMTKTTKKILKEISDVDLDAL